MAERGTLWYVNYLVREHIQLCPEILVLFGDNAERTGMGGQAFACRGEPNVLGIPVKWRPSRDPGAYYSDLDITEIGKRVTEPFMIARDALLRGQDVAYPFSGIGVGRAMLQVKAPKIFGLVGEGEKMLKDACRRTMKANNLYLVAAHKRIEHAIPD